MLGVNEEHLKQNAPRIPVGINEVKFVEATAEPASANNDTHVLRITFMDKNERLFTETLFPVDKKSVEERNANNPRKKRNSDDVMTADEQYAAECNDVSIKLAHIAGAVMDSEDVLKIKGKTFKELYNKAADIFNKKADKDLLLRALIQFKYQSKYQEFPKYPPFIEPVSVQPPSVVITNKHNMTPPGGAPVDVDVVGDAELSNSAGPNW